ncbi:MAG: hypothetical protein C0406_09560 [Sideroxydans sp.]|nr:hypothetical protein [Sideroxydans sp.]
MKMDRVFTMAIKILLLLIGGGMLLGGGFCVVTNVIFLGPSMFERAMLLYMVLMGISALVAWLGWKLIRWARSVKSASDFGGEAKDEET